MIDFTFSLSANWQKLRRSLYVPLLYTYISLKTKNDRQGGSLLATSFDLASPGRHCIHSRRLFLFSYLLRYMTAFIYYCVCKITYRSNIIFITKNGSKYTVEKEMLKWDVERMKFPLVWHFIASYMKKCQYFFNMLCYHFSAFHCYASSVNYSTIVCHFLSRVFTFQYAVYQRR